MNFQDVHDHMSTIQGLLVSYLEMVSGTMDTYVSLTTHRMDQRDADAHDPLVHHLPLTHIASLFGMNLNLPFQKSPHGFCDHHVMQFAIVGTLLWFFQEEGLI